MSYVPYFDNRQFNNIDEQMSRWGRLADWADVELYEWTKSSVHPSMYEDLVAEQEGDASIPANDRSSGVPKKTLYFNGNAIPSDLYLQFSFYGVEVSTGGSLPDYINNDHRDIIRGGPLDLHINGVFHAVIVWDDFEGEFVYVDDSESVEWSEFKNIDYIEMISQKDVPNLIEEFDYITVDRVTVTRETVQDYYFWVRSKTVRPTNRELSLVQAEAQLKTPNVPYVVFRKAVPNDTLAGPGYKFLQMILRGVSEQISADDRFKLQMTRDYTLRDDINDGVSLKTVHTEWKMFRQESPELVPEELWIKMTEALAQNEIEGLQMNPPVYSPVPSLERSLYDETYGTDVRFGLRPGQTFTDSALSLRTIQELLESEDYSIAPLDKTKFFNEYSFDTPVNIAITMNYIYTTFPVEAVNRMFFETLHDALSLKKEYPDIFKTSMVALHGIKLLETSGNVINA
jgi:hypothetical protein